MNNQLKHMPLTLALEPVNGRYLLEVQPPSDYHMLDAPARLTLARFSAQIELEGAPMFADLRTTSPLTITLAEGEDGYIVAEVMELPGCISQGATITGALANIAQAITLYLEDGDGGIESSSSS